jgi:hypothetical protein
VFFVPPNGATRQTTENAYMPWHNNQPVTCLIYRGVSGVAVWTNIPNTATLMDLSRLTSGWLVAGTGCQTLPREAE